MRTDHRSDEIHPGNVRLDPLTEQDFDAVARLADTIWRGH